MVFASACSPAHKAEDKDKLPPQLVDFDSGTYVSAGTKAVTYATAHNETLPVNVNEEYPIHHVVRDAGGKMSGVQINFKTDSDVTQPQSVIATITKSDEGPEKNAAPVTLNADFIKSQPGVWTATINDAPLGNNCCVDLRFTCKALKEGNATSEITVVPIGAPPEQGATYEDNHSVMGEG